MYLKDEVFVYVGRNQNLKDLKDSLAASHLYWKVGSMRSFTAIKKNAGLLCGPYGELFAYVGISQTLKVFKNSPFPP